MNPRTFERFVREAVESVPEELRSALHNIDIVIEEFPSPRVVEEMGPGLLGLYEGTPLPERDLQEVRLPDKITLYRGEFLLMGITGRELVEEIRTTVSHELGHYFGFSDEEMEMLEPDHGDEEEDADSEDAEEGEDR